MMRRYQLSKVSRWVLLTVCAAFVSTPVTADETLMNKDADDVAIQGYDTVAYFTEERAVKGKSEFEFEWHNARWRFTNEKHRDLFAASPERYAPQFGGLCAGAMVRGVVVKADPEAWTIVDGKLYMKVNKQFRDEWREDPAGNISKATKTWAGMQEKK